MWVFIQKVIYWVFYHLFNKVISVILNTFCRICIFYLLKRI